MLEQLLNSPGFVYQIGNTYYYLGKWICKECTETDATDSYVMYRMCRNAGEESESAGYFHKLRAHSDFALEIPYNPAKIKGDMTELIEHLPEEIHQKLEKQLLDFAEDFQKYCGN